MSRWRTALATLALCAMSSAITIVVIRLTGNLHQKIAWHPLQTVAASPGASPSLPPELSLTCAPGWLPHETPVNELSAAVRQADTRPLEQIVHDIVDAELHRLYPAAKPDGGSRLSALYPGTSRLAVWATSELWYVAATDPFVGNTVGVFTFGNRASGLVLERMRYCADPIGWPATSPWPSPSPS